MSDLNTRDYLDILTTVNNQLDAMMYELDLTSSHPESKFSPEFRLVNTPAQAVGLRISGIVLTTNLILPKNEKKF